MGLEKFNGAVLFPNIFFLSFINSGNIMQCISPKRIFYTLKTFKMNVPDFQLKFLITEYLCLQLHTDNYLYV